jgi:hypothetical protein
MRLARYHRSVRHRARTAASEPCHLARHTWPGTRRAAALLTKPPAISRSPSHYFLRRLVRWLVATTKRGQVRNTFHNPNSPCPSSASPATSSCNGGPPRGLASRSHPYNDHQRRTERTKSQAGYFMARNYTLLPQRQKS